VLNVTRAQNTSGTEQQVGLGPGSNDVGTGTVELQRVVGLPLGSPLTLTDQLRFMEEQLPAVETAVAQA